jgi:polysaccharide pyruvyl transferase WcaK-like protein
MPTKRTPKPILLLGAYGRGNAGDDVFIICALQVFKGRTLYMNTADTALLPASARNAGIQTISTVSMRDALTKIRVFLRVKEVVYWGGDLWVELYGTRRPRQLLYKMLLLNCLLRLAGKRVYYIGCGIGDLHGFSLGLARLSARMAHAITVREQRSAGVLNLKQVSVLPDLAVALPYHRPVLHRTAAGQPFSIVVSVMHSLPDKEHTFPALLQSIADLINSLPPDQYRITILPMHISEADEFDDLRASEELARLITAHPVQLHTANRSLRSVVKLLRRCNLVIGTRLHANILAMLNATPCIGIAYRPKVRSFFAENKLENYVLGLDQLEALPGVFHTIHDHYETVAQQFYQASKHNLGQRTAYAKLVSDI